MVQHKPERVKVDIGAIPRDLISQHMNIVLTVDIMFVNQISFLVTWSRGIQLITIEHLPNHTSKSIGYKLNRVIQFYARAGFRVQATLMDKELDMVAQECPSVFVNTAAANEHVPKVERAICLIKE